MFTDVKLDEMKADLDRLTPLLVGAETTFRGLEESRDAYLSRLTLPWIEGGESVSSARMRAQASDEYKTFLEGLCAARERYLHLKYEMSQATEWVRMATAWMYRENARLRAGV